MTRPDTAIAASSHVTHPGPVAPDRLQFRRAEMRVIEATLEPGQPICEAIRVALEPLGITGAAITFESLALEPMRYVMPAFSDTPERVAFYSRTYAPEGPYEIDAATATYGYKDGVPFIHCHALWHDADETDGPQGAGHILPFEARLARPVRMIAYATDAAGMTVAPDAETGFDLFGVTGAQDRAGTGRLVVAKIRPNEDLTTAIAEICTRAGARRARILSGIGSTVGATFEDGTVVRDHPTELLVAQGDFDAARHHQVEMEMILVDVHGTVYRGRLAPGKNPVLICFELFLEITDD